MVCSSPGRSVQLRCSHPSPGGRGRNISVSCQSNRGEQVTPEHNTPCSSSSKVPAPVGHSRLAQQAVPKWEPLPTEQRRAGKPAVPSLTLSSGPSEKELAPRSSPSWPGAPGCRVSEGEECKGKAWNRCQWFCLQPWVLPHPEPLPGQHLRCPYKTAVMEGPPSVPGPLGCAGSSQHPLTSWEVATQHSSHLEKGETHIILKDDAANTPHITGLAPAKL